MIYDPINFSDNNISRLYSLTKYLPFVVLPSSCGRSKPISTLQLSSCISQALDSIFLPHHTLLTTHTIGGDSTFTLTDLFRYFYHFRKSLLLTYVS